MSRKHLNKIMRERNKLAKQIIQKVSTGGPIRKSLIRAAHDLAFWSIK